MVFRMLCLVCMRQLPQSRLLGWGLYLRGYWNNCRLLHMQDTLLMCTFLQGASL
jgi:hypothetical protein